MKKVSFVWSCCVMTFFVACQQAEVENLEADDLRMSIVASINDQKETPDSRYAGETPDKVEFTEDDAIGLFVDNNPAVEWVYDGEDDWSSGEKVVYWPDKTRSHTFRAFYPYAETETYASVPMPSLLNQTGTIESISKCDFLIATKSQTYTDGGTVEFKGTESSFKHVSTLLQLTFVQGSELTGAVLNKIKIEGSNIVASSSYSFDTENVTLNPNTTSDVLMADGLSHKMSDGGNFYFIVNEKKDGTLPVKLTVEYTANGKKYVAQKSGFANNLFAGGMCQKYTVTVQNSSLIISGNEISSWGTGVPLDNVEINGEETTASV